MTRIRSGNVRHLPSGRFQARFTGPDGRAYSAPGTFPTKTDAHRWLTINETAILTGRWTPPSAAVRPVAANSNTASAPISDPRYVGPVRFQDYAISWVEVRQVAGRPLRPRTRAEYLRLLRDVIGPTFAMAPLAEITPADVRSWWTGLGDRPTTRARAYGLLRAIMATAADEGIIPSSPVRIRGGGVTRRQRAIRPATLAEVDVIAAAMPDRLQMMVLLGAWCALRFGEITELRRGDVDVTGGRLRIRRVVARYQDEGRTVVVVGDPKTDAGSRDVAIPPHLMPAVRRHLAEHTLVGSTALLFPAANDPTKHLAPSTFARAFYAARDAAGRSDLTFHALRHTGATLAATTGATLADLMARLGHTTPQAAMIYQHAASDRDQAIAEALSALVATAPVVAITSAPGGQ